MSEELALRNIWKKNPDVKHIPIFYGSNDYPVSHLKLEYLDMTLEQYLAQETPKQSIVELSLQMFAALKEMHKI